MNDTSADTKGPDPLIGRLINDRYKIVSVIARGGMGKVYRAEQAPLGRQVALKVLSPNFQGDSDPEFHRRFFLEASISSKLTHPNTVTVFDYGRTDDDVYYIAMELLEGRTLHRAIRDEGPFSPERAVHITRQICRSLREAHAMGVIHRDLKPANIFLIQHGDENDFVKVLDFGLVKDVEKEGEDLTQTGLFMGSPKYMAPEQIRGERVDPRTDVYALGVITYEMLTGKVPFDRASSVNILMAHVHDTAPSMGKMRPGTIFTPELEAIVAKAMAKKPEDRYGSMDDLMNAIKSAGPSALAVTYDPDAAQAISGSYALTDVATTRGSSPSSESSSGSVLGVAPQRKPRGSNAPKLIAAGVLIAAAIGGGLAVTNRRQSPPPARPAPAVVAPTPPPTPAPPVPAAPTTPTFDVVRIALRSEPVGAQVLIAGEVVATTPADLEWTGADAAFGREVTFTFHLEGHRDYTVMRTVRSDSMALDARLEAIPTNVRRPGSHSSPPPRRGEGFHTNPY